MQISLLVMFAILIFAIIGLEFYSGALHKTCYSVEDLSKSPSNIKQCSCINITFPSLNRQSCERGQGPGSLQHWQPAAGSQRQLHVWSQPGGLPGEVGGAQLRHHVLWQHHLRHVDCLPVHHHGGVDAHIVLGKMSLLYLGIQHTLVQRDTRAHLDYVTQPCDIWHMAILSLFKWVRTPQDKIPSQHIPHPTPSLEPSSWLCLECS